MGFISNLQSSYNKWKSEADQRAERAIKNAQTKAGRDAIKDKLAIETAQRKRLVAKAQTEQKQAELARKKVNKDLKGAGGFDFLDGFLAKPKPKAKRKTTKRAVKRSPVNRTMKSVRAKRK